MARKYSHGLFFTQAHGSLQSHSARLSNVSVTNAYPTIAEIRRANLKRLIAEHGTQRALADTADLAPAQISQWVKAAPNNETGKPRVVSDDSARSLETRCGKPVGWMDHLHDPPATIGPTPFATTATPTLEQALPVVLEALSGLTPGRWAMVRARLDSLPEHPEMRDDVAVDVLPLLQPAPGKQRGAA